MRHFRATVLLCALALEGCAIPYIEPPPVPPTPPERVPVPPAARISLIWQPGHYDWTGTAYVWIPGEWVDRAGHGTLWQDGFWRRTGQTSEWVPAHWL